MSLYDLVFLHESDSCSESDYVEQRKKQASPEWREILDRFPIGLQREIVDERDGKTKDDLEEVGSWHSLPNPVVVPITRDLVLHHADLVGMSHPEVIARVNKRFDLNIGQRKVYDKHPERVLRYAKMPPETARPSVMIDGEIGFGVGRFLAALIRGDKQLRVWKVSSKQGK